MNKQGNKRNQRLRNKVNQGLRQQQRMYIAVGITCMFLIAGMLAFFYFSSTQSSKAIGDQNPQYVALQNQIYVNDLSIARPFVRTSVEEGQSTIFTKKMVVDTLQH